MKATLKLEDGREIAVDVSEETLKQIEKPVKKTGYERVKLNDIYYLANTIGEIDGLYDNSLHNDLVYQAGNYYSDKTVAENNARADILMRNLRRFAVEHRERELDWKKNNFHKWSIEYNYDSKELYSDWSRALRRLFGIYFDTKEAADTAIEEFKDELIWYFTEYKDSL